jgi:D-alanyl-D-alanine dipeptidase/CubicO group peptidase (beta-lactamase class C family)
MHRMFRRRPIAPVTLVIAALLTVMGESQQAALGATIGAGATACRSFSAQQLAEIGTALHRVLQTEQNSLGVPSGGVALFGCVGILWSGATGFADKYRHVPAGADTVFRAGTLTGTLTSLAMMRLVDRGALDLDAPVTRYVPDFAPRNPFQTPITLRMLAAHRSGLVREPPVGSYYSTIATDLASVVRSLNDTALLSRAGTVTRYSDAGIAVIGRALELVSGKSYIELMREELLGPAHMPSSALCVADSARPIAYAELRSYDAPRIPAPVFDLGIAPAAGLSTTLTDMGSLGTTLLSGRSRSGRDPTVGFVPSSLEGHRLLSSSGAVHGFVSKLEMLPDEGIGAVAYGALDSSSFAARMADYALQVAVAVGAGKPAPADPTSRPLWAEEALPLVGEYRHDQTTVMIRWMGGAAFIETPRLAGRLRRGASGFVLDDSAIPLALDIDPRGGWLEADGIRFARAVARQPAPPAPDIVGLLGDYGWDHASIRAFERDGSLFARLDGVEYDRLSRVAADTWQFPPVSPCCAGEDLRFRRDGSGNGTTVALAGIVFPRRNIIIDPPAGKLSAQDRALLRERALAASPPAEPAPQRASDLVSVLRIDPSLKLDVRYATSQNLLGFPVYSKSAAYLQRPAAQALARADKKLHQEGFGIVVFDAYRPWFVTKMFWDGTPAAAHVFVADPSEGSRHNRGAAADISIVDLATGQESAMTGAYDEFSPRSYPLYDGGTSEQRWRRDLLRAALESEGFSVYPFEWWHFDYGDWRSYGLQNMEFSQLPP